jgi:hypothetical protein
MGCNCIIWKRRVTPGYCFWFHNNEGPPFFYYLRFVLKYTKMRRPVSLYLAMALAVSIALSSCKKDDCEEIVLTVKSLEELYGCTDTRNELIVDLTNTAILITNQTDYETQIDGPCAPAIDFVNYDLVIGKTIDGSAG